jgi:hypothetical protein
MFSFGVDSAHAQCRSDAGLDIVGVHGAVEQQDIDELPGPVRFSVNFAGGSPERLLGARERRAPAPGQRGGSGKRAGLGLEDLQIVVQLDRLPGPGGYSLMPGSRGTAVGPHDFGRL